MSGDLSEDERVALAALDQELDDPVCDSHECKAPAEFSIVVHGMGVRHNTYFRCSVCYTAYLMHNTKHLQTEGVLVCLACNQYFRSLGDWWTVRRFK